MTNNVKDYTVEMTVEHITEETTHSHTFTGDGELGGDLHTHNYTGKKKFTVHNGLKLGDKVILLREQGGQRFVVLDRFERTPEVTKTEVSLAGIECEQAFLNLPDLVTPKINNIKIQTIDSFQGIYKLSVSKVDCCLDSRAAPFFFFKSQDGVFEDYMSSVDAASVIFKVNSGVGIGNAQVRIS